MLQLEWKHVYTKYQVTMHHSITGGDIRILHLCKAHFLHDKIEKAMD